MQALQPRVRNAVWAAIAPLLPQRPPDTHPLGCHRRRLSDRVCIEAILVRLVTGCSWRDAAALSPAPVSATTLRERRDYWVATGVFSRLHAEALAAYDRIIGLDPRDAAVDGSTHKAPGGGEGTGPNPTDRGKRGWKWSILTERAGIPLGWAIAGANRHDSVLFEPTLADADIRGLLADVTTLHLDRGYDSGVIRRHCAEAGIPHVVIAAKRRPGTTAAKKNTTTTATSPRLPMGPRWPVERTNSWLSNFGQLRRNTDRVPVHRHAQLSLAVTLIITVKLFAWADRWNR